MAKTIYIGNLSHAAAAEDLENLFADHGTIQSAEVVAAHAVGRNRRMGVVIMSTEAEASAAILALDGVELDGRLLTVGTARP